jgi:predicted hotdog family 3-hydroxylacyl-ACP dehydratase
MKSIEKSEIEKMIPHSGNMCLLDKVVDWDNTKIHCVSTTHLNNDNPLRSDDTLSSLCGIEYAAQAMAVHGGLTAITGKRPKAGYLASVRDINCMQSRLDNLTNDMHIHAEQIMGDDMRVIYQFKLLVGDVEILNGRATVVLDIDGINP